MELLTVLAVLLLGLSTATAGMAARVVQAHGLRAVAAVLEAAMEAPAVLAVAALAAAAAALA